jgi:hypothetical protein
MKRVLKPIGDVMPTKTKFQQLVKSIEGSNKKFEKASGAGKIVMVARDVLAMLAARRIKATTCVYVQQANVPEERVVGLKDMSELLKLPKLPPCNVCAIGAAMFATTLRLDNVPISHDSGGYYAAYTSDGKSSTRLGLSMSSRVRDVFPNELLRYMEHAFEYNGHGYKHRTSSERLTAIYTNLVENKGKKFTNCKTGDVIWEE